MKNINPFTNLKPLTPIPTGISFKVNTGIQQKIKAVIFDIYGTLLISSSGDIGTQSPAKIISSFKKNNITWDSSVNETDLENISQKLYKTTILLDHNNKKKKGIDFPEIVIESIWEKIIQKLKPLFNLQIPPSFDYKKLAIIFEFEANQVYPMPQSHSILKKIDQMNLQLGIVSNAQFFTPMLINYFFNAKNKPLEETNLPYFNSDLCFYSYQEHVAKPSTSLYEKLTKSLQKKSIKPEETLFVGNDMLNDIYGASQVGFKTVLFAGDKRSLRWRKNNEKTKSFQADFIIQNLDEILICLDIGSSHGEKK